MDPNQQNPTPTATPPVQNKKRSKRTVIALICLLGPTILLIGGFMLFAILNLIFSAYMPATPVDGQLFGGPVPVWRTVLNVISFLVTSIAFLAWLPGIIVGIVLLATAKPATPPQA